ncbi:MAG: DPP IV N-terminal domain-containing protein [Proteobacteria bacterium]|nr:DPP IV N-terminal domain-containing protein [Pseudomonadota bacterium]
MDQQASLPPRLTAADYARAEAFLPWNMKKRVRNAEIRPYWIGDSDRFWYRRERVDGHEFVLVEAASGERGPAFDHAALAKSLAEATGQSVRPMRLPFDFIEPENAGIGFAALGGRWFFDAKTATCRKVRPPPASPSESASPDGVWVAFAREHNLWLRKVASGAERRLTQDGIEAYAYAKSPDSNLSAISHRLAGIALPPAVLWSPDSRHLVTHRLDERAVATLHLLQSVPSGSARPVLHIQRIAMPGEAHVPLLQHLVIEVASGRIVEALTAPQLAGQGSSIERGHVWWGDGATVYILDFARAEKSVRMLALDAAGGGVRTVIEERAETFVELRHGPGGRPNVRVIGGGAEVIWFSQKDGWGHLYLHDGRTGELKNRITEGSFLVRSVLHVDPAQREIYFTAGGRDRGIDPYWRKVYRASLDGSRLECLTPDDADHTVFQQAPVAPRDFTPDKVLPQPTGVAPSGRFFVATASRIDVPSVTSLSRADGTLVATLETADVGEALGQGWRWPEPFTVKAADGVTDLYGAIWLPSHFDPARRYPVLDLIYPGPQRTQTPKRSFAADELTQYCMPQVFAELGIVVVAIDGRGTPYRSKEFHDVAYQTQHDPGNLGDHIAGLQALAKRRPYMDLERVGITGHSGGGFASVRAMLAHPDFYKVAVASSGNHDQQGYSFVWGEKYIGPVVRRPDGTSNYDSQVNLRLAERLQGKLMLAYGDMDDNVHGALTLQLADALIKANKDFELVVLPNANHPGVSSHPYFIRRKMDFFLRHLVGAEPPGEYNLKGPGS